MRKMCWLLLALAGCGGPDADPVDVAQRFHEARVAGDDRAVYALLTDADRAALPLERFPGALPPELMRDLLGRRGARLVTASRLATVRDTTTVVLHLAGYGPDTLRLAATHEPLTLWKLELDRVRWRVAVGLPEWAVLDSLAKALRPETDLTGVAAAEQARAYLQAAERNPSLARPSDLTLARSTARRASVAEALDVDLRVTESFMGANFVSGEIANPSAQRVATLRFTLQDVEGREELLEIWDIPPRGRMEVSRLTNLSEGALTHRLERIQVY
ncbi:MAG: hypothetical protein GWM90_15730 [Gemmatimonadetes bacterium]|nr:hypothetical protein [Gemmatimonadota bacterium]NIQ55666.1 hypothetical protein [Gemmatimonadota bacterium]NIU75868.1 hypothetical protein [Gammaproteobacteria bacterium]NIX45500.1 hypothetical protein [Gemmatimonadota bacterium]NIY09782.1 hypothetical protein [Gemmatimonadota bacterium]